MRRSKHVFHCAKCQNSCQILRKGRGHRVLLCPNCGILATNPLPLAALLVPAAKIAGTTIGSWAAWKALDAVSSKPSSKKWSRDSIPEGATPPFDGKTQTLPQLWETLKEGGLSAFERAVLLEIAESRKARSGY